MKEKSSDVPAKKVVIILGVTGAMSAVARARRLSEASEIIVLEHMSPASDAVCKQ